MTRLFSKWFLAGIILAVLFSGLAAGEVSQSDYPKYYVTAKLFTQSNCTFCDEELDFLNSLKSEYDRYKIEVYSIDNQSNMQLFKNLSQQLRFSVSHVPVLVVGRDYYVGFGPGAETNIRLIIDQANVRLPWEPEPVVSNKTVILKLFWREGCPHCATEKEFLKRIAPKYPQLGIELYDVDNESNIDLLDNLSAQLSFSADSVPVTIIGKWYRIGYSTDGTDGAMIEAKIKEGISGSPTCSENTTSTSSECLIVDLPIFGRVDLRNMGVPLSTVVIGLMDGINPCAFFVLTMLLSFMVYARSRSKMLIIGLTFVFISGFVYFLFMTAMFSAIRALNEIRLLSLIGGGIALVIGLINLKDFFFFKKGVSLTISEDKKPKLYKRMRDLLKSESMVELVISTIILAFVANSYELLCTAGFPIVYGNLLNSQQLDMVTSILYIALYNFFYVLPLLVIVLIFAKSLGGRKLTAEQGELLKSISGIMMLGFGVMLIIFPNALSNIFVAISLIVVAVLISLVLDKVKKSLRKGKDEKKDTEEKKTKRERKGKNEPAEKSDVQ